ncbi:MAG: DUF2059 domain-containing protein [Candidatus Endonucleobacter sp. (ex Gigantidas childressi)]|nr:DUF2059 domain-containing protein [Candidatus Endonucleobacter sp. (ex Gigantidas childressi)]
MKDKKGLIIGLAAAFLITVSQAYGIGKMVLLDELYEKAEIGRYLQWIRSSMQLSAADYALASDELDAFNQVVKVRYRANFFKTSMMNTLDEALTVKELLELVAWYDSPLGQKIQRLEADFNNPANTSKVQAYINERLSKELPRSSRTDLIEELMEVLDVVEHGTDLAASASVGGLRMLKEVMPTLNGIILPQSHILMEREKAIIRRTMAERMKDITFYTYRGLSDQEVRRYIDFSGGMAMQNLQRGQVQAIKNIL